MTCDRCEEAAKEGCRFCPKCGEPLDSCTMCAEYARKGYEFCGRCGRSLTEPAKKEDFIVEKTVFITVICVAVMLVIEAIAMLWHSVDTYTFLKDASMDIILLLPSMITVGTISGVSLQLFWIFVLVTIIVSCIIIAYQSRTILDKNSPNFIPRIRSTPVYWIALFFGSYLILSIIISAVEGALGYRIILPEELPSGTSSEAIFTYAQAAVWEEVISRLIPIGIPMMIVAGLCGHKDCLRYLFGGFGVTRVALVLIVISAVIFGMAHEGAWGGAKIIPTVIGGLLMGYLYVRFGIHASIVFHFLLDYSVVLTDVIGHELFSFIFILVAITGFVAVAGLFKYMKEGVSGMKNRPVWVYEKVVEPEPDHEESSDSSLD